jgi:hypothetical protein
VVDPTYQVTEVIETFSDSESESESATESET